MAKPIPKYRAYTTGEMKSRSYIPDAGDIAESGNQMLCSNIKLSDVKSVLGLPDNKLSVLCAAGNQMNLWSCFSPVVRSINSQEIVNSMPVNNFSLGSWAGYNHEAVTPSRDYVQTSATATEGNSFEIAANITIGEVNFEPLNIYGLALAIYDGVSFVAADVVDMSTLKDGAELTVTCPGVSSDKSYTGKFYFINDAESFSEGSIIAKVPNCADFTIAVTVLQANYITVSAEGFLKDSDDQPLTADDCSFSSVNGTFGFPTIYRGTGDADISIYVRLVHQVDGEQDVVYILGPGGSYTANDRIPGDTLEFSSEGGSDPGPPYSSYGWRWEFLVETSS